MPIWVFDGSMGRELMNRGVPKDTDVWAGRALINERFHSLIVDVHQKYMLAGAQSITTFNYTVQPNYYSRVYGSGMEMSKKIFEHARMAGKLAYKARQNMPDHQHVLITGSLPPMLETFRPDLVNAFLRKKGNRERAINYYRLVATALSDYVDAFHLESMSNWAELSCVIEAIKDFKKPIWIFMNGIMPDPETHTPNLEKGGTEFVKKVLQLVRDESVNISVIGFNCAPPDALTTIVKHIPQTLKDALKSNGIGIGLYANFVEVKYLVKYDSDMTPKTQFLGITPKMYLEYAKEWEKVGITHIGGCCGVGPDFIKELNIGFSKL